MEPERRRDMERDAVGPVDQDIELHPRRFPEPDEDIVAVERVSSSSSSSSTASPVNRQPPSNISRQPTASLTFTTSLERNVTALSRIQTHRDQHSGTVGKGPKSREPKDPLPAFGAGKPYPPDLPEQEVYVVEFDGEHDTRHGQNWPLKKKLGVGAILGYTSLVATFTSSVFSPAISATAMEFNVSTEVGILGVSFYVLGFATGPTLWAPLSELRGRRLPLLLSMFGFSIFQFGVATAKDLQTVLLCRFWGGFFGGCPLAVVAAIFTDIFDNRTRGLAITVFSMTVFMGPLIGPFVGGFIAESYLGWRWTGYIPGIMGAAAFILNYLFLEETYPPVILIEKAAELRRRTKNWGVHAKQEEIEIDFRELMSKNFTRPLRLLFTEPIIFAVSLYMSFLYGILYLFLTAYPIAFQQIRGWNAGVSGLPFFGMILGELCAGIYILLIQPGYNRKLQKNNGVPKPEWRLPPVIVGGVSFGVGLLWFGWAAYRANIHWIAATLSGILTGFGLLAIFVQCLNYIVDSYLMFAASALAGNTLMRSTFGAAFPLFAGQMFRGMGIQWASTFLGIFALCLVPIPIIFLKYGAKLRAKSKFAPTRPKFSNESGDV